MDDTDLLIKRVKAIDKATPEAENTLMDGYARVLALEAEQVRLERRFTELAQAVAEDHDSERPPELRSLRQRIASTNAELTRLRRVLTDVRQRLLRSAPQGAP